MVYDPTNHLTNLLTQANTLKSTINEATMIANQARAYEQQAQSLLNEATNLKTNPLKLLGQIEGMWDAYNTVMKNAEGVAFNLTNAAQRFQTAYPGTATASVEDLMGRVQSMMQSITSASKTAVNTQSIYERLCNELDANKQALTAAQASVGQLQISQAQAQIQALTNEQLGTLAQIEAATGRVQTEWIAAQVQERQSAIAVNDQFMGTFGTKGFKTIGQSPGVELK